jgi:single-strand DNA-binding protein
VELRDDKEPGPHPQQESDRIEVTKVMQISAHGRIGSDPKPIATSSGKPMAVASIAVSIRCGEGEETQWLGLVAFGAQAELLLELEKGDMVAVMGRAQLNRWRDKQGQDREGLQVVVDHLISAKLARPKPGSTRVTSSPAATPRHRPYADDYRAQAPGDLPFDDELNF